jgi:hypothetical protein
MTNNEIDLNSIVLYNQVSCVVLENGRWVSKEFCDRSSEIPQGGTQPRTKEGAVLSNSRG